MKTVVILGAGQAGRAIRNLLNPNHIKVVAFGDNNAELWDEAAEIPVLPVEEALRGRPDLVLIGVLDEERGTRIKAQLNALGYTGEVAALAGMHKNFDIRSAALKRVVQRIHSARVEGAVAELGVYRGDFAWQLNELLPDRKLYLFDTFQGFSERDLLTEREQGVSGTKVDDFTNTREKDVLARMPHEKQVVLKKGRFPETALGLEENFCLVSIDADLYAPTLAGLEYFWPRLSPGGFILLHDYNSRQYNGVKKALEDYEAGHGKLPMVPLGDLHGTAVIVRS